MNATVRNWGVVYTRAREHYAGRLVLGRESDTVRPVLGLIITWWLSPLNKRWPLKVEWSWGRSEP